jgi:hypothetical protein
LEFLARSLHEIYRPDESFDPGRWGSLFQILLG